MFHHLHAACAALSLAGLLLPAKVEATPPTARPAAARPGYWWVPNGPGEWALELDGRHVGSCKPAAGLYLAYAGGEWSRAACPVAPPPVAPVWPAPPRSFFPPFGGGCAGGRCR